MSQGWAIDTHENFQWSPTQMDGTFRKALGILFLLKTHYDEDASEDYLIMPPQNFFQSWKTQLL